MDKPNYINSYSRTQSNYRRGGIVGTITMFVGVGITGTFISTLAAGLTKSRIKDTPNNENDPEQILKMRLAKGEITKEVFLELKRLISSEGKN